MAIKINIDDNYFNEVYLPYLDRQERYQIFYGGAGSGKSNFLASNLILSMLKKKQKLLVVREIYATIRDSVFGELMQALDKLKITKYCKVLQNTMAITLPNGSEIIFKGADDESKLLSITGVDLVWIEEADGITKEIFNQLELRLRGGVNKKRFFLSFNPVSTQSWLKAEFFDKPKADSFICHTTYKDNKFLDDDYIQNIEDMAIRNPAKYQVYALGKWGTNGKLVYENWSVQEFSVSEIVKSDRNIRSAFGMDFGYITDPSTLVAALVDETNRKLYVFDEMYEHGLLNNEIADRVKEMGYAKESIIADSAEQKSIAELRKYGLTRVVPAKKGAHSIAHGIQYLSQYEIIVHPDCVNLVVELENYGYKKNHKTGQYLSTPIDDFNHLLDALRYALEPFSMKKKSPAKGVSKGMFGL